MLDRETAEQRAAEFLAARSQSWSKAVRLIPDLVFIHKGQLIAPYNSVAFLDGGDWQTALGGNTPVLVDLESGDCRFSTLDEVLGYLKLGLMKRGD